MRIPQATREAVKARSGGMCESCHLKRAIHMHHREHIGMGGARGVRAVRLGQPENIIHLCLDCHRREHS